MIIRNLILFATAPLNDVHRRSYKTHMDNQTVSKILEVTQDGTRLTQQGLSQVAAEFIRPSAESEGVANIVNGWGTARYRWLMETEERDITGNVTIGFYIGHTNYCEGAVIRKGGGRLLVDDNLQFFVNSAHKVKQQELRVHGQPITRVIKDDFSQLLYGTTSVANVVNGGVTDWRLRPSDIFKSQEVTSNIMTNPAYNDNIIFDFTGATATGTEASSRRNNTPGTYLFDTLSAFKSGTDAAYSYGGDETNVINEALTHCTDRQVYKDPLFSTLRDFSTSLQAHGQFSYAQLKAAIPYIDDITAVNNNAETARLKMMNGGGNSLYGNIWNNTNTEHWGGSDNATIAAQLLVNAVPTILLESLGSELRCTISNMTPTGEFGYQVDTCEPISMLVAREDVAERAVPRIINELMKTITLNGMMTIVLTLDCSVYGETMITINLNGEGDRTFVMPTFTDNAASPVVTSNNDRFMQVSNDIYSLGKTLFEASPLKAAQRSIIQTTSHISSTPQMNPINPINPMIPTGTTSLY